MTFGDARSGENRRRGCLEREKACCFRRLLSGGRRSRSALKRGRVRSNSIGVCHVLSVPLGKRAPDQCNAFRIMCCHTKCSGPGVALDGLFSIIFHCFPEHDLDDTILACYKTLAVSRPARHR